MDKKFTGYSLVGAKSPFNFTMDRISGKIIIPEGVPAGTVLRYRERQNFSDGTFIDSDWISFIVKQ